MREYDIGARSERTRGGFSTETCVFSRGTAPAANRDDVGLMANRFELALERDQEAP